MQYISEYSADTALRTVPANPEPKNRRRASRLPQGFFSVAEAAAVVGRAPSCLYEEVRRGRLRVSRWRGRMLVKEDELRRWITPDPLEPNASASSGIVVLMGDADHD